MQFEIPCDTVARLAKVLRSVTAEHRSIWTGVIRYDDGVAVASSRRLLAAERIGGPRGVAHLIVTPDLLATCTKEAAFDSRLYVTVNEMLRHGTAKTTLGYVQPGNCIEWSDTENFLDNWRSIVPTEPAKKPVGGMFLMGELIADLGAASPSGGLIFEEIIDATRPALVRDFADPEWFGMFMPNLERDKHAATLPEWMK